MSERDFIHTVIVKLAVMLQLICALFLLSTPAYAEDNALFQQLLEQYSPAELFPSADRITAPEGDPAIATVFAGDKEIGLLFFNSAVVNATGYSGKPIHILVGLGNDAVIRSVRLVKHHEPIVLVGIPESKINALIDGYIGLDLMQYISTAGGDHRFDAISGATVTVRIIDDSIIRSAIKIARLYGLGGLKMQRQGPTAEINAAINQRKDWIELISEQAITRLKLTTGRVNKGFMDAGYEAAAEAAEAADEELFIDFYVAQVSVPSIGRSLLGESEYKNMQKRLSPGQQAVLLLARGPYSFKGSGYVRGGIFDRFEIIQGDEIIRFTDLDHKRLGRIAAEGAPQTLREIDLFIIPEQSQLAIGQPWHIQLLVSRETGPREKAFITFNLDYHIPDKYLIYTASPADATILFDEAMPLWQQLWLDKRVETGILITALVVLSLIFFFQNLLVQNSTLTKRLRLGFLLFTLFFLGFYANAQLSVVNILTVLNAMVSGFSWEYFLMEPLIFILWGGVFAGLLLWGRGAYCGWLCPFGALQELSNRLAKLFHVPQWMVPWGLHERLWPLKYMIFLGLFGVSLHSLELAERLAEVEPFKTVIILKFIRDWPYVLFALLMLLPCLFVERFYCRYLCPLGAALAIPASIRTMKWLKRYKNCGDPCQTCSKECMVQAIHPEGFINPNECLYCLHCQERYYDEHVCPVQVKKRKRQQRRELIASDKTASVGRKILDELLADKRRDE